MKFDHCSIQGLGLGASIFIMDGQKFHNLPLHCLFSWDVFPGHTLSNSHNVLALPFTCSFLFIPSPLIISHDINNLGLWLVLWKLFLISPGDFTILRKWDPLYQTLNCIFHLYAAVSGVFVVVMKSSILYLVGLGVFSNWEGVFGHGLLEFSVITFMVSLLLGSVYHIP